MFMEYFFEALLRFESQQYFSW